MAKFAEAENRIFKNVWVCMKCNATMRSSPGQKPDKCRKCNAKSFRAKRKSKK